MINKVKITCIFLVVVMVFSLCACKTDNALKTNTNDGREQSVSFEGKYLIKDKQSNYKILLPQNYSVSEMYAANELNRLLEDASGKSLEITETADLTKGTKYLSIGNTVLAEKADIDVSYAKLKRNGFRIDSYQDGLIINAPNESGLIYGVYRFLEKNCNYMYYSENCYKIDKGDVPLKTFRFEDWPDFENRDAFNYNTRNDGEHAMRLYMTGSSYSIYPANIGEGQWWSSLQDQSATMQIVYFADYRGLHPEWYVGGNGDGGSATNPQLCYTEALNSKDENEKGDWSEENYNDGRHGLFWTFVYNIINNYIMKEPTKSLFQIGISDNDIFCSCENCSGSIASYGRSGTVIRFVNQVAREVEKWRLENCPERQIYLTMFAYWTLEAPPIDDKNQPLDDSVMVDDNVIIRYAPICADYMYPLNDMNHNADAGYTINGWLKVAKRFAVWDYRADFSNAIRTITPWVTVYQNLQTYYDMGVLDVFSQGFETIGDVPFMALDNYVRSRLMWNRFDDYEHLMNDFIANYYGPAAEYMAEYIQYITCNNYTYLIDMGINPGDVNYNPLTVRLYPFGFVKNAKLLFEKMYASILPIMEKDSLAYSQYKTNINNESVFYRYLEINLYNDFYTNAELTQMIDEIEEIVSASKLFGFKDSTSSTVDVISEWRKNLLE